eukprot:403352535
MKSTQNQNRHQMTLLTLSLILLLTLSTTNALECAIRTFPYLIGGEDGLTTLKAIAVDSKKNIVAGGFTTDDYVIGGNLTSYYFPIVFMVDLNGRVPWKLFFRDLKAQFSEVDIIIFNKLEDKIILHFNKMFKILILNALDGTKNAAYEISSNIGPVSQHALVVDSNENIYFARQSILSDEYLYQLISFKISSDPLVKKINLHLNLRYEKADDNIFDIALNQQENMIYLGGQFRDTSGNTKQNFPSLMGVEISTKKVQVIHLFNKLGPDQGIWNTLLDVQSIDVTDYVFSIISDKPVYPSTYSLYLTHVQLSYSNICSLKAVSTSEVYIFGTDDAYKQATVFKIDFGYSNSYAKQQLSNNAQVRIHFINKFIGFMLYDTYVIPWTMTNVVNNTIAKENQNFCPKFTAIKEYPDTTELYCYTTDGIQELTTFIPFTYTDSRCTDIQITYTLTSDDMTDPSIFTLNTTTNKITCNPTLTTTLKQYTITITGTASVTTPFSTYGDLNPKTSTVVYSVTVQQKVCNITNLSVTMPVVQTMTYYYGNQAITFKLNEIISSEPLCPLTMVILESRGIDPAIYNVTYDSIQNEVIVGPLVSGLNITDLYFYIIAQYQSELYSTNNFLIKFLKTTDCINPSFSMENPLAFTYDLFSGPTYFLELNCTPISPFGMCQETLTYEIIFVGPGTSFRELYETMEIKPFKIVKTSSSNQFQLLVNTADQRVMESQQFSNQIFISIYGVTVRQTTFTCYNNISLTFRDNICTYQNIVKTVLNGPKNEYIIGDPPLILDFDEWTSTNQCGELTYNLILNDTNGQAITILNDNRTVTIYTSDLKISSFSYKISIQGTLQNNAYNESIPFLVKIINPCDGLKPVLVNQPTDTYFVGDAAKVFFIQKIKYNKVNPDIKCLEKYGKIQYINPLNITSHIASDAIEFSDGYYIEVFTNELSSKVAQG